VRGRVSPDQRPFLHCSGDQVLAKLGSCVHFYFPPNENSGSALFATELGSQFLQQRGRFRVPGEMNNLARTAKTVLHKEDLKVAELVLSGSAKCLRGQAINAVTGDHGSPSKKKGTACSCRQSARAPPVPTWPQKGTPHERLRMKGLFRCWDWHPDCLPRKRDRDGTGGRRPHAYTRPKASRYCLAHLPHFGLTRRWVRA
jgi:hypothetical protein